MLRWMSLGECSSSTIEAKQHRRHDMARNKKRCIREGASQIRQKNQVGLNSLRSSQDEKTAATTAPPQTSQSMRWRDPTKHGCSPSRQARAVGFCDTAFVDVQAIERKERAICALESSKDGMVLRICSFTLAEDLRGSQEEEDMFFFGHV